MEWEAFFSFYPFTQDREDIRTALLASTITNISGKSVKNPIDVDKFLPDYLGVKQLRKLTKSKEQQRKEFSEFKEKLEAVKKGRIR